MQNKYGRRPKKINDTLFSKTKKIENEQIYLKRKSNEYSKKD